MEESPTQEERFSRSAEEPIIVTPTKSQMVSILIPTWNSERYMRDVLDSIGNLNYDHKCIETIVVDAMSSDATPAIAREHGCKVLQISGNVPRAYNFAIQHAKGEFVAFADSDALVERDWLRHLVNRLDKSDQRTAGVGGMCMTRNDNRLVARLIGYDMELRFSKIGETHTHFPTMNLLCRKDSILEIGGFNETLDVGCDVDLGMRLMNAGYKLAYEPKALVFHWHRDNIKDYARQQFTNGRNVPKLLLDNRMKITGSSIDPPSMYAEPIVLALAVAFILAGLVFSEFLLAFGCILGTYLPISFASRTVEVALKKKSSDVVLLMGLYTVRVLCWILGAIDFLLSETLALTRRKNVT